MGGNLFKLGRIAREEYLKIEKEICSYLDKKLGEQAYRIPRYYANKPDFGDLDVLLSYAVVGENWPCIRQEMMEDLGVTQTKSEGSVFSTVYKNFQVDYFVVQESFFESTYNFMSFNDLGNLLGKICRKFQLKYGEKGLVYVFRREDGHYKKDLLVSTDFQEICQFLQLDYSKWQKGFQNLEEVFEWVIQCPYFSVVPYQEQSKTMEKRAKQRKTIQEFLEYLQKYQITKTYDFLENKDDYLPLIMEVFPRMNLQQQIEEEKIREKRVQQIQQKFNGRLVMELLPSLKGKAVGDFIVQFKNQFEDFEQFILDTSAEEVKEKIKGFSNNS